MTDALAGASAEPIADPLEGLGARSGTSSRGPIGNGSQAFVFHQTPRHSGSRM